jgi:sialate O-acetylesterase
MRLLAAALCAAACAAGRALAGPLDTAAARHGAGDASFVATVEPCVAGGSPSQAFSLSSQYGGVVSVPALGACLCSLPGDAAGALSFQPCEGPGAPLHARETGWNFTGGGAMPKAGTGLCATAPAAASGGAVALAACAPGAAAQRWAYDEAAQRISSGAGALCLTAAPAPLPLLSNVFGSHMVLQRGVPTSLWGWTTPGAAVVVALDGATTTSAPAGPDGRWVVTLPPTAAGTGHVVNITSLASGGAGVSLVDVAFGEVVWCSGQSNLSGGNTPVSYAYNATAEIAAASLFPWVRVFAVGTASNGAAAPLPQLGFPPHIPWSVAAPSSVAPFSATCWFTGKALAEALGPAVPIGLVESAWGGTSIQVWVPPGVVDACGNASSYPGGWPTALSSLWNAMTEPFAGMQVAHIVWYQGESNALTAEAEDGYYLCALPFLVGSLRSLFNSPTAFAAIVQLAPWASSNASFNGQVAALRQAQLAASDALPHMATITAVDGGDPFGPIGSIHPRAKQLVGRRLAAAALTAVYGQPTPFAGPRYASAVPGGGAAGALSATVSFAAPSAASPGNDGPLRLISPSPDGPFANSSVCPTGVAADLCAGFALRGSDNVWYAAVAALGAAPRTLVLTASAADVPAGLTATATASGWSLWPITLLYSSGGLPAWPWNASVAPAAAAGE